MSPVRQVLTDVGDWSLTLKPSAPRRIRDLFDLDTQGFARIAITPTWLPAEAITPDATTGLIPQARYTGILRETETQQRSERAPTKIGGCHLAILFGDEDSKGDIWDNNLGVSTIPFYDGSNDSWVLRALNRSNGIEAGNIVTSAADTRTMEINHGESPRKILDTAGSIFPTKRLWRVTHTGYLDYRQRSQLFRTGQVAITPDGGGRDGALFGIRPTQFTHHQDVEDWSSSVVIWDGPDENFTGFAAVTPNPYDALDGADLTMLRVIDNDKAYSNTAATNIADTVLARFDEVRRQLTIRTDLYDPAGRIEPGDTIYVYDPAQDLIDLSVQVYYRGQTIFPLEVRVEDITWPVRAGMGVYHIAGGGSSTTFTDLTPYIEPEDGDASIGVGAFSRTLGAAA